MEHNSRDSDERNAHQYLKDIEDAYVLNQSGRLYLPRTENAQRERTQAPAGENRESPIHVNILRDWIPIIVSVLTFLLLCATVFYTRMQWMTMNDTLGEVAKQTVAAEQSATASDRSSLTSQRSERDAERSGHLQAKQSSHALQATIDNFHEEERAWLGVCDISPMQLEDGKPILVSIKLCNSGKSPASSVQERVKFRLVPTPKYVPTDAEVEEIIPHNTSSFAPQGFSYLKMGDLGKSYRTIASSYESSGVDIIAKNYDFIKSGAVTIFYYGDLRYSDAFGKSHKTKFCIFLGDPTTKEMLYCPEYNDMD